jgi:chromosome partitioning protein
VLLIDGDEQGTAKSFTELRNELTGKTDYTVVTLSGLALRSQVRKLAPKYEDIIIDVGGRDTGSFRAALTVTQCLLIPVQPRTFDVWALDQVASLLAEARAINESLRALSALNMADPAGRDNEEAARVLAGQEALEYLPAVIVRRKAFPSATAQGKGVLEYTPKDAKAVSELLALITRVYQSDSGEIYNGYRQETA